MVKARVVIPVRDISFWCDISICEVSWQYLILFKSYGKDTVSVAIIFRVNVHLLKQIEEGTVI